MWRRQCGRSPACRCGWCLPMATMTTPAAWGHSGPVWSIRWQPLREGDTLECGGYRFEVLHIPGHTPGSIALLDREHGLLLPGDSIQKEGAIYMFGLRQNLERYLVSLRELQSLEGEIRQILAEAESGR